MAAVLLVCTANICRSPMAEAIFKARLGEVFKTVASAGVHADPRGGPVDARAAAALERHKYGLERRWRSRRVDPEQLGQYDLVLAMEAEHVQALRKQAAPEHQARILMLTDFLPEMAGQDIPDPYFGPVAGFDAVIGMIERAATRLLAESREGRLRLR
ncbi:low molecular weight protein-tyrosine-phosphatase [Roseateles puraquae]|uniref:protein-tyrosine-phosphatase n=1 Tax=Roseateles puraquae TaxID=431059 RepID=A0A254N7Z9_9BURK|nr:low molecular weight protein-tyrosine-phosphatase [Roseateles puraquae]MDG0853354.1 low molecular weight phosphotyrosine protein phosphatase [Roseateles puraquae]OWR02932.1 protein tyrosine phosphatase [Roseateles puraquae]